ncbi:hypothetical protein FBU30_003543 [Linnemannia zychae]|nr:hypothetical protein FBU30_003543 [Linnemannia zychae]
MALDRERDLSKYASLLTSAKTEQDRGDLKAAYGTYLEAHGIIIRILSAQIVFNDKGSLESAPSNYTQLLAHAQEILRRLKDIIDLLKSHAPTSSSPLPTLPPPTSNVKSSKPSSVSPTRPGLGPSRSSQRSIATTNTIATQTFKRTRKNIPMIPISPLTKQSLLHSYALSQVTQKLEQAKQGSNPSQYQQQQGGSGSPSLSANRDLAHLRRLIEDVRIQRAKFDNVNLQIQSVASSTLTSWDPDTIAKQLTIIDTQLFKDVAIPRDLVRADRHHNSRAQNCIDFENYIAHSFAHLLLIEWAAVRQPLPASTPGTSKSHNHTPINAIAHTIRIAQILLHVYRNFNGFKAVMRALTSPEIKRMHKLWSGIPSKTKDTFRRLVAIYQDQAEQGGYKGTLIQKLDAFQDVGRDAMVAIPWMRYHQDEVKSIIQSYLTGQDSSGGSIDIVLSAPGARKLSAVTALLLQCRSNDPGNFDRQEAESRSGPTSHTKHRELVQVDGTKTPLSPVWDLYSLGSGDATLHHWLLSRPFLNKQQLIDESLEIEPLFHGEELPCFETPMDLEDNDDLVSLADDTDQNESFEQVVQPEHDLEPIQAPSTPTPPPATSAWNRTPVSESEVNDIMNELLNDESSDNRGIFDDLDDNNDNNDSNPDGNGQIGLEGGTGRSPSVKSSQRTRDVFDFLGISPEDASDDDEAGGDLREGQNISFSNNLKNKGKSIWSGEDDEEIDDLMAKVRGLVHESKTFAEEIESKESAKPSHVVQDDFDSDPWSKDDDVPYIPGKKFEPFLQGDEDEWGSENLDPIITSTPSEPPPSALSSLDALRRQFNSLSPMLTVDDGSHVDNTTSDSISLKPERSSDSKNGLDITKNPITIPEAASPSASTQGLDQAAMSPPVASSNPFAPYMHTRPMESTDSSPSVIGKGRKRKIIVDRSGQAHDQVATGTGLSGNKTPTALSPPKRVTSVSPLDSSDEAMAAIAARARMSLAGMLVGTDTTSSSHPGNHDGSPETKDSHLNVNEATSPPNSKSISSGGSGPDDVVSVSIQELDKTISNSSPPSFVESTSSLLSQSMTAATKTTTTIMNSRVVVPDSEHPPKMFQLGANLYESTQEGSANEATLVPNTNDKDINGSTLEIEGHHLQQQQNSEEVKSRERNSSHSMEEDRNKSPKSDHEGAMESESAESRTRSNRQRRRIAGGVISLPTPSKTLVAMGSASSLSNAFKETAAVSTDRKEGEDRPIAEERDQEQQEPNWERGLDEAPVTTESVAAITKEADDVKLEADMNTQETSGNNCVVEVTMENGDVTMETPMANTETNVTANEASLLESLPLSGAITEQEGKDKEDEDRERL